jgi:hypothetical protein
MTTLLESPADYRAANELRPTGQPIDVELATNLAANLRARPRPFALLMPRARAELLQATDLLLVGQSRHYMLYVGP